MIWALWVQIYWYNCAVTEHGGTHGRMAGMGRTHTHTLARTHTHRSPPLLLLTSVIFFFFDKMLEVGVNIWEYRFVWYVGLKI